MAKKLYEEGNIQAIANAIRGKNGLTTKYKPSEMAAAINSIPTGGGGGGDLPEEALVISGTCNYRFASGGWDWFIEAYGNRITTEKITSSINMFDGCKVELIPFDLNFNSGGSTRGLSNLFRDCENLKSIPKINSCLVDSMQYIFSGCKRLRNIPADIESWFDWSYLDNLTSQYSGNQSYIFSGCYSLRSIPVSFFNHGNPTISHNYSFFNNLCANCHSLDELVNLPIPYKSTWTGNAFSYFVQSCGRLKALTFAMPDGQPYVMNWKSQVIDLTSAGCTNTPTYVLSYNSGITEDKKVINDATYQALKDDSDWWTNYVEYSRYNHDSAVNTINSLPDTSAYLATAGGTNTIKFKGAAGSATDGGAINTLTEAEIAAAAAKGWTVSLS